MKGYSAVIASFVSVVLTSGMSATAYGGDSIRPTAVFPVELRGIGSQEVDPVRLREHFVIRLLTNGVFGLLEEGEIVQVVNSVVSASCRPDSPVDCGTDVAVSLIIERGESGCEVVGRMLSASGSFPEIVESERARCNSGDIFRSTSVVAEKLSCSRIRQNGGKCLVPVDLTPFIPAVEWFAFRIGGGSMGGGVAVTFFTLRWKYFVWEILRGGWMGIARALSKEGDIKACWAGTAAGFPVRLGNSDNNELRFLAGISFGLWGDTIHRPDDKRFSVGPFVHVEASYIHRFRPHLAIQIGVETMFLPDDDVIDTLGININGFVGMRF